MRQSGVLRVGMDASFPPFEWISPDGEPAGLDVALARELGRRLGAEVQFVANLPYDGLYDALAVCQVDVIISSLVIDSDRTADVIYSQPYFDAGQVLVVPCTEWEIRELADLQGQSVAVELGSPGDLALRRSGRRLQDVTMLHCQTAAEALDAVVTGVTTAALSDRVSALQHTGACLKITGNPVVSEPYAIAGRQDSARLMRAVDEALAEMAVDGTLTALIGEYIGVR
ncbi:MAG: amino acid ABC transporter substrate-binding protein [Chloroflexi bacterium]|nr:amino acid ABC transporter substrate-binding protein [Chloroflexota bacterium]